MTELPASLSDLTAEFVSERLAAGGHDVEVASVGVAPVPGFNGLMGEVQIITLDYAGDTDLPTTMFGKCPRDDDMARMYNEVMNSYKREHGFYRDLADQVPMRVPTSFVNEYDEESGRGVLLLEMIDGGTGDILDCPDLDEYRRLVEQLGTMHGRFWQSPAYGDLDWALDWNFPTLKMGIPIVQEGWPPSREKWPDMAPTPILDFFERTWIYDTETWLERVAERPWTLTHMDYEFDNMAFTADGPIVFDWQTPLKSYPGGDLAWFLGVGATDESVAEEDALLDAYLAAFTAAGGPAWSKDDLLDDMCASLQFHCTGAATTLNSIVDGGAPPEDRGRRRFEKMLSGMMDCAVRWNVLDRVPE